MAEVRRSPTGSADQSVFQSVAGAAQHERQVTKKDAVQPEVKDARTACSLRRRSKGITPKRQCTCLNIG